MLKRELIDLDSKEKHTVSFFEDDNIQTVREQLAKSSDSHPDRMFVLANIKYPKDYYTADIRNWDALFERLSYNGRVIEKNVFDEYQRNYRFPNTNVVFKEYTRTEWLSFPADLKPIFAPTSAFTEYRILGVADIKSFVLPVSGESQYASRIPAANIPRPDVNILISSFYEVKDIDHFAYKVYDETKGESSVLYYYPYLRSSTPNVLSEESIQLLDKNSKLLKDLLALSIPKEFKHSERHILKTRFHIPWVKTDFGSAIRVRFEQMFYGMTVSEDVPYIGYFTSNDDVNRHKFYVENPKNKEPFLDVTMWKTWISQSKPSRQIPTLMMYRGKSKHHFDRIIVTDRDMLISTYRTDESKETVEDLKKSCEKWLQKFDAIMPFINPDDIHPDRWELQDIAYMLDYPKQVLELNTLRFNCISPFYGMINRKKSEFTLLRSNQSNSGITSVEAKLIQMSQEGPLEVEEVAREFSVTLEHASKLIRDIITRREEGSRLGDRLFRGFPSIEIGPDFVRVRSVQETDLSSHYVDLLRYILSNPNSDDLNTICPPRMQTVSAETAVISTSNVDHDAVIDESFADLLEGFDLGKEEQEEKEDALEKQEEELRSTSLDVSNQPATIYNYFKNRLKSFDPETFVDKSDYPKKCEQKRQPVVLDSEDKKRLTKFESGKYDPIKGASEEMLLDVEDPSGTMICPEYWCMRDEIPLREDQLLTEDGTLKCPVCHGKLQTSTNVDLREYPLIKRDSGFVFPRMTNYKSPANNKSMPCCYKKARTLKPEKEVTETKDKYYVFLPDKRTLVDFRLSKLDLKLIDLLALKETYKSLDNQRIPENVSGYFRAGLGHASDNLPTYLGLEQKIPYPRESVSTVLKCSFMRSWTKLSDEHLDEIKGQLKEFSDEVSKDHIARIVSGIDEAYSKKQLSPMQEIEYTAIALQCDVFRVNIKTYAVGCVPYGSVLKARARAVIILQNGDEFDILTCATRKKNSFEYKSNILEEPYRPYTRRLLESDRTKRCVKEVPTYTQAVNTLKKIFDNEEYLIILDPYGRGQALYIPDKAIFPFQSAPLPDTDAVKLDSYSIATRLPKYENMKQVLEKAQNVTQGYEFQDALYDANGNRTEILTASGLRIPVQPEKVNAKVDVREVVETVSELGEKSLTFGVPSEELEERFKDISYEAEVYEFLIFQLSKDIQEDEYGNIRDALQDQPPNRKKLETLLRKWFDRVAEFVDIKEAGTFLTKIRTPCGQFAKKDCKGNLCGWDGKVCRTQIKKSIDEEKLFKRLFTTLYSNSKIRAVVLDGRTTPFFSTILYIELPHELIVTDKNEILK